MAKSFIFPLSAWFLAVLFCTTAYSQSRPIQSVTKQFTAKTLQTPAALQPPQKLKEGLISGSTAYLLSSKPGSVVKSSDEIALTPSTLVVSCERVKKLILNRLGMSDQWRGRIDLTINPGLSEAVGPQLRALHSDSFGWSYLLDLPPHVKEQVLMRSIIQTVLLEIANRSGGIQSADVPFWLVEGLGTDIEATSPPTFIVQPEQNWTGDVRWNITGDAVPVELRHLSPLSFQELSFPQNAGLGSEGIPLYRTCARLFVEQLLEFKDGRACLSSMVCQLPQHWNWQTSFLNAFHDHFATLLDVEKWWSVSWIGFVSGTDSQLWSTSDCRKTLQNSLDVPVDVHFGADQMPVPAKITLQEVIKTWAPKESYEAVMRCISELRFLYPRATADVKPLVLLYVKTLSDYSEAISSAGKNQEMGRNVPSMLPFAKSEAVRHLDELDRRRQALGPVAVSTNVSELSALGQNAPKARQSP